MNNKELTKIILIFEKLLQKDYLKESYISFKFWKKYNQKRIYAKCFHQRGDQYIEIQNTSFCIDVNKNEFINISKSNLTNDFENVFNNMFSKIYI